MDIIELGFTRVSPLSLDMLGGSPAGSACSKIGREPVLAASYMRVAKAMTSGDSGVGWVVVSPWGAAIPGCCRRNQLYGFD